MKKMMSFLDNDPVRSTIISYIKILEQILYFRCLGCDVTYKNDMEIPRMLNRFHKVSGFINKALKRKSRRGIQLKRYDVKTVPLLLYGRESCNKSQ